MITSFVAKLGTHSPSLGTWISIGSPVITEIASSMGFEWLLFDLEHGCFTEAEVLANLQAVRGVKTTCIVRAPSPESSLISRLLDRGADGIMVPHVTSAAIARGVVKATRYAPAGTRGYSRTVRAYGYGMQVPESTAGVRPIVLAQIENLEGVKAAEDIAAVDGVDVLFVGPADLTQDLASHACPDRYAECIERVGKAATARGKAAGILVRDKSDISSLTAMGYTVLAVDSDLGILRKGYQDAVKCIEAV